MKNFRNTIVIGFTLGAFALAIPLSAQAQEASVGGNGSGGIGASVGAAGVGASASVGGGANADADASVGGPSGANASASVGTDGDPSANVDANVGNVTGDVDVGTGDDTGIAAALGLTGDDDTAGAPGTATPGIDPSTTSAIDALSDAELTAYKKKCIDILRSPASFESDLVDLCALVREAAAR